MATINNVTDTGQKHTTETPATEPATPEPAPSETARAEPATTKTVPAEPQAMPATVQLITPATPVTQQHRSTTLIAAIIGAVITALIGGMFLFMIAAFDDVRAEISTLRNDNNARFAEVDRKFDQVQNVLLDHTDRLARIETALDIEGRPTNTNTANR